jgi:RNA polymerase sigma-70 factor, ECF subfamily
MATGMAGLPVEVPSVEAELEGYRRELTGYCYRMLGSMADAEDAVQESMARAWRAAGRFEGRSSVRTWLYRIATNVCLDELGGRQRRVRPMDLAGPSRVAEAELVALPEGRWLEPAPDGRVLPSSADPAEQLAQRESVRLAFVAALQHLPPRQRAVLLFRDVLRWRAAEVAELLETSVPAVNSALQRARVTLDERAPRDADVFDPLDEGQQQLLRRYVDAFERYDMAALRALLHEDATQDMPPYDLWLQGREEVIGWMVGPGGDCAGSRLVPTVANGMPAFGQYRRASCGEGHEPWALQVIETRGGQVVALHAFLGTPRLFPIFGLPGRL